MPKVTDIQKVWRTPATPLAGVGLAFLFLLGSPVFIEAQDLDTSDGGESTGTLPESFAAQHKVLPRGFFVQDTSIFSSGLLSSSPSASSSPNPPASGSEFQTGLGYAVDGGWTKATPLTIYSVLYSTSFITYQRSNGASDWNQYLNASIKKKYSPRLQASFTGRFVLTDDRQFLFGNAEGGSSDYLASKNPLGQSSGVTPTSNLLLTQKDLFASSGAQVSYDYSPHTTVSFSIEAIRNEALGLSKQSTSGGNSQSTSGSLNAAVAYELSSRESLSISLSSTKTLSALENSVFTSALSSFSYALSRQWFFKVQAGVDLEEGSADKRSSALRPIGGATLGYAKNSYQLLLSSTRGVVEIFGGGTGVVWSSNAAWSFAPGRSPWSLLVNASFDRTNAVAGQEIAGWRTSAEVRRALGRHFSIGAQYAYLLNSYRNQLDAQGLNSQGLRLSVAWTPVAHGSH